MKAIKYAAAAALAMGMAAPASADQLWSFGDVSVNYLDWSDRTEDVAGKKDFLFLELEGGAGYTWGDVYGFFDIENPGNGGNGKDQKALRTAMKGAIRYNILGDSGLAAYAQFYNFSSKGFSDQNRVFGLSYSFSKGGFWAKPFVGLHSETSKVFNGTNGYMVGWVLGYSVNDKISITNWTEIELDRKKASIPQGGSKTGLNGAVAAWYKLPANMQAGVQYRFAESKLGSKAYQNALIYTLKYNF